MGEAAWLLDIQPLCGGDNSAAPAEILTVWKTEEHESLLALNVLIVGMSWNPTIYFEADYHTLLCFPITCFVSSCSQVASLSASHLVATEPRHLKISSFFLSSEQLHKSFCSLSSGHLIALREVLLSQLFPAHLHPLHTDFPKLELVTELPRLATETKWAPHSVHKDQGILAVPQVTCVTLRWFLFLLTVEGAES